MCAEGVRVLERFAEAVRGLGVDASEIDKGVVALGDNRRPRRPPLRRGDLARDPGARRARAAARVRVAPHRHTPCSSSASARSTAPGTRSSPAPRARTVDEKTGEWVSGTFRSAAERLPAIADMGFDVVYLTPIHPIGTTARKGRNNTLTAQPGDPGSPYAIGSPDGGHDAIHPDLGTFEDFDLFVAEAGRNGLEVALDIALQASPDHPWVQTHPDALHDARRRHHRLRREPAEEVPGHLPAQLRQRPRRGLRRGAPGHPGVARPRRAHLPRRQPAHQAGRLLAVADRRRRARTTPRPSGCPRRSRSRR